MAVYFVDSTTGDNGDSGLTMDLAWATLEYAMEAGSGVVAGDWIFVRRIHSETPTTDILVGFDGTQASFIHVIGWPRAAISSATITEGDWTNGSTTVDNIVGITCDREKHQGRFATGPDSKKYLITRVVDSNTVIIDRGYVGTTVTGTNGAFSIYADEDWADDMGGVTKHSFDDSGWTIQESDWDGDNDDLPVIDFNNTAFQINASLDEYWYLANLDMRDSIDTIGVLQIAYGSWILQGCLLHNDNNAPIIGVGGGGSTILKRCVLEGAGAGNASNDGIDIAAGMASALVYDSAIYNCGGYGFFTQKGATSYLENVNIGVEVANQNDDIYLQHHAGETIVYGRDVKLGGTNGDIDYWAFHETGLPVVSFENYQKVLGDHWTWNFGYEVEKVAVSGETPSKKNSDDVIKINPNTSGFVYERIEFAHKVFVHEYEDISAATTYTYHIWHNVAGNLNDTTATDDIWLEAEYVDSFSATPDPDVHTITKLKSTAIDLANGAWRDIAVTLTPATSSKVRITMYVNHYHATRKIWVDPEPTVT